MTTLYALRLIVRTGVSSREPSPCRRAWRTSALAPYVARSSIPSFRGKESCLGRASSAVVSLFADTRAECSAGPPGRRRLERQHRATAEGKIKGRGTSLCEKAVCTWGWRSTRQGAAACRDSAPCRITIDESVCLARRAALVLDGVAP